MSPAVDEERLYRWVLRRGSHRSRALPACVAACIIAAAAWSASAVILARVLAGRDSLSPLRHWTAATLLTHPWIGMLACALGLTCIALAVLPGRRPVHCRTTPRAAVMIDDTVLASTIARAVAARCRVAPSQVGVVVRDDSVRIRATPTSGVVLDPELVRETVADHCAALGFRLRPEVTMTTRGAVA